MSIRRGAKPQEEEQEVGHPCCGCGQEFLCQTPQWSADGKRFKCQCLREKDKGVSYYFCSEECMELPEDEEAGEESDGYEEA